ncbi:MAG: hypothetical protein A3H69_00510 [Candidatus Sungbacteria bacterium RIFCSPLOWO2_02_FULL_47_9]|nr:MAG: hypothetical protein A3H69_00510 [Candidatus Sungbacteria bacterium RIFCSPLOWO2_02_FULL_47_9]
MPPRYPSGRVFYLVFWLTLNIFLFIIAISFLKNLPPFRRPQVQKRAFGLETEYSALVRKIDRTFHLEECDIRNLLEVFRLAMPFAQDSSPVLKELLFYPPVEWVSGFYLGTNGARFYVDNYSSFPFPEYATPETRSIREALIHGLAGDAIMEEFRKDIIRRKLFQKEPTASTFADIYFARINTQFGDENAPASTGLHENYLTERRFYYYEEKNINPEFCEFLAPFLASRQIFDGAGAVRNTPTGWKYLLSQRASFVDAKTNSGTMATQRGLVHFRPDKEDAPENKIRLHLHCGDTHMSPFGKYIAMGATHMVLRAFEERNRKPWPYTTGSNEESFIASYKLLSYDPTLKTPIFLKKNGSTVQILPLELQREYFEFVLRNVRYFSPEEAHIMNEWSRMTHLLSENPEDASEELDWAIKQRFLLEHCGGDFSSPKAQFANFLYHDISERGIYNTLLRNNKVKRFATAEEIFLARNNPPDTRAEFRSRFIKTIYPIPSVFTVSWSQFSGDGPLFIMSNPLERTNPHAESTLAYMRKRSTERGDMSAPPDYA